MTYQGKRSAKGGKRRTGLLVIGVLLAVILAVLVWVLVSQRAPKKIENSGPQVIAPDDVLQTPYGELSFPGIWTDKVAHETVEDGSDLKIVFRSTVKGAEVELFTLYYGAVPEGGYVLGQMSDGTSVGVVMNTIEPDSAWPKETLDTLYSLQESVNDLLVQLQTHPELNAQG